MSILTGFVAKKRTDAQKKADKARSRKMRAKNNGNGGSSRRRKPERKTWAKRAKVATAVAGTVSTAAGMKKNWDNATRANFKIGDKVVYTTTGVRNVVSRGMKGQLPRPEDWDHGATAYVAAPAAVTVGVVSGISYAEKKSPRYIKNAKPPGSKVPFA